MRTNPFSFITQVPKEHFQRARDHMYRDGDGERHVIKGIMHGALGFLECIPVAGQLISGADKFCQNLASRRISRKQSQVISEISEGMDYSDYSFRSTRSSSSSSSDGLSEAKDYSVSITDRSKYGLRKAIQEECASCEAFMEEFSQLTGQLAEGYLKALRFPQSLVDSSCNYNGLLKAYQSKSKKNKRVFIRDCRRLETVLQKMFDMSDSNWVACIEEARKPGLAQAEPRQAQLVAFLKELCDLQDFVGSNADLCAAIRDRKNDDSPPVWAAFLTYTTEEPDILEDLLKRVEAFESIIREDSRPIGKSRIGDGEKLQLGVHISGTAYANDGARMRIGNIQLFLNNPDQKPWE